MVKPEEIKQKALQLWTSGKLLRAWLGCEDLFPMTFSAGDATAQMPDDPATLEAWKSSIEACCRCHSEYGYRIEYLEINHPRLGRQRIPSKLIFDDANDMIAFIGKRREASRFARLLGRIKKAAPSLVPWCERYPMKVLGNEKDRPQ